MRKCIMCGSDNILLWLGGSIGTLYHCADCHYIGPVILKGPKAVTESGIVASRNLFRAGNFWSETGIGNRSLFDR